MQVQADLWRQEFPIFSRPLPNGVKLVYLDSAATTHKPKALLECLNQFYAYEYATVHRAVYQLAAQATARYNQVREDLQAFLNAAHSHEIIFTRGTTESINLVATCLSKKLVKSGDQILISAMEHHSNLVPWQMLCEEKGAQLKVIPLTQEGHLDLDALQKLLKTPTRLVAVTHVSNVLGLRNPVEEVIKLAHAAGALVLVDGAQSAPHGHIDVQKMDCDFFVFSGHKLYGPTGIGILYGKEKLLELMPPYQGGGDMIQTVTFERTTYQNAPLKFEAGTPMIAEVLGLGAVLKQLNAWQFSEIYAWEAHLMERLVGKLSEMKEVTILGPKGAQDIRHSLVSFTVKGLHPLDLATLLDLRGIALRTGHLCAQPLLALFGHEAVLRFSVGLYNTEDDIDMSIEALKAAIKQLS